MFKSDNGIYLSYCSGCWCNADSSEGIFVAGGPGNSGSQFEPSYLGNGKWAFRGLVGNYLAVCNNCFNDNTDKDFAFANTPNKN